MVKIKKGDFIRISYTLRVKETGQIIETTDEKNAKKEGIFDEKNTYGPRLMIVGNEDMFLRKLNNEMIGKEVGEKFKVEVPPEETFGYKDLSKIKVIGRKELIAKGISPEVGKQIQWGKQTGTIISSVGGRIRVDFNHPLVGKTIVYSGKIGERITTIKEKIKALIDYRMPDVELDKFSIATEKGKVTITIPEEILTKDPYIQFRKIRIAADIHRSLPERKEIVFVDIFSFNGSTDTKAKGKDKTSKD